VLKLIEGTAVSILYLWHHTIQQIVINLIPFMACKVSPELFVLSSFFPLLYNEKDISSSFFNPVIKSTLMILKRSVTVTDSLQ